MKKILAKCTVEDFQSISEMLDSYASFTNDKKRVQLLALVEAESELKADLIDLVEKQIRYFGSSDIAYLKRKILAGDGGVSASELLNDVSKKLRCPVKIGSFEARLERLVHTVVEKELADKSPAEVRDFFKSAEVGIKKTDLIEKRWKHDGTAALLPVLFELLGPKVVLGMMETIVVGVISNLIGREAAKHLVRELIKRNPWANALGPIIWTVSGAWIAYDIQGPAYRKTIPVLLYLGVVALRDGAEPETVVADAHAEKIGPNRDGSVLSALKSKSIKRTEVKVAGRYTEPRTYGVYRVSRPGSPSFIRFGNYPIRKVELEREYGKCKLEGLFLDRKDAVAFAKALESIV